MNADLKETVIRWIAERNDEAVFQPTDQYYHIDTVIDAFAKGREDGKSEVIDELRRRFISTAEVAIDTIYKLILALNQSKFTVHKLFMNHSIGETSMILSIDESQYVDDAFIDFAYKQVAQIQDKCREENFKIKINFISESTNIDLESLIADGYQILYDIENSKVISR